MSMRIRELASGVASCVMLLPTACDKTPATVSVDPGAGAEPVAQADPEQCETSTTKPAPAAKGSATTGGDGQAPTVTAARFTARDRVQLIFSEAIAPAQQVNPRQFRLSMAYSMINYSYGPGYGGGGTDEAYASGYYYDLAGTDNYEPPLVVTALETYEDRPEALSLRLSRPIPTQLCDELAETKRNMIDEAGEGANNNGRVGLFLHYTSRGSEGIRDLADNAMSDMGGEWALHFGARNKTMYGSEPIMRLDLLVELACPEGMAPGGPAGPI